MKLENIVELIDEIKRKNNSNIFSKEDQLKVGQAILNLNTKATGVEWETFAALVNYKSGGQNYKRFVLRNITSKESDDTLFDTLYKEKTKARDIYNTYRKSLRETARKENFKEELISAVQKMTPITKISSSSIQINNSSTEAILMLSDLHLGVNCNNFYNTFNYDVAVKRLNTLAAKTIKYCQMNKVKYLNVINLGDMIHGIIHTTARINQQLDLVEQITKAAELISIFLVTLLDSGAKITYRSCTDNHSRASANKDVNLENENFSKIIDWYIQARLKDLPIKFINDNIDDSLGKFNLKNGKLVMFAHGHLESINKCIDSFVGASKQFVDYVLLSHFHSAKTKSYNGSKLFINGSIVGTEEFALSKRLFGEAEQKLLIFKDKDVVDIDINLQ